MTTLTEVRDKDVFSSDGEKVGTIRDIYYDEQSSEPEWVGVGTGFLGMSEKVVPVEALEPTGDHYRVPYTKDQIRDEPDFNIEDGCLLNEDEARLWSHFGLTGQHPSTTRVLRHGEQFNRRM
jgi:sporulation protein YlmC with PRC-barrel domain